VRPQVIASSKAGPSAATLPWKGPALIAAAVAAAVALVHLVPAHGAKIRNRSIDVRCESWDRAASAIVGGLIAERDALAEIQLRVALFRLLRARRNCREGWVETAWADYDAVMSGRYRPVQ
jgi:hypothetical protein